MRFANDEIQKNENFEFFIYFKRFCFWQIIKKKKWQQQKSKGFGPSIYLQWMADAQTIFHLFDDCRFRLFFSFCILLFKFFFLIQQQWRMQSNPDVILIGVNFIWNECGLFENYFLYAVTDPFLIFYLILFKSWIYILKIGYFTECEISNSKLMVDSRTHCGCHKLIFNYIVL